LGDVEIVRPDIIMRPDNAATDTKGGHRKTEQRGTNSNSGVSAHLNRGARVD